LVLWLLCSLFLYSTTVKIWFCFWQAFIEGIHQRDVRTPQLLLLNADDSPPHQPDRRHGYTRALTWPTMCDLNDGVWLSTNYQIHITTEVVGSRLQLSSPWQSSRLLSFIVHQPRPGQDDDQGRSFLTFSDLASSVFRFFLTILPFSNLARASL
jgi:hypothetical protein